LGKKCIEEFNPWPPFVDMFSSVILVLLLFMLILIVEVGYYSQFKFKKTYEGKEVTHEPIFNTSFQKVDQTLQEKVESKQTTTAIVQKLIIKEDEEIKPKFTFDDTSHITKEDATLETGGYKLKDMRDDNKTKLTFAIKDNSIIVDFEEQKQIFLEAEGLKQIKLFLNKYLSKKDKLNIILYTLEPSKVYSATISKQISLNRAIGIKNFITKQGFTNDKINLNLFSKEPLDGINRESGAVVVQIKEAN
jgi:hypothetical protein